MKTHLFSIFVLSLFAVSAANVYGAQSGETASNVLPDSLFNFKELILTVGDQRQTITRAQLNDLAVIEPVLKLNSEKRSEIENINFCPTSPVICRMLISLHQMSFLKKETAVSVNKEKIGSLLSSLAEKFNKEPVDAKFQVGENGLIDFAASQEGTAIDVEKSIAILSENLNQKGDFQETREIALPFSTIEPKIKSSEAEKLGINTLIGEGVSNFRGSPKNRIFNINVGTEKFNGVLIAPGEEFSFVETLGPVDGEHGYAPELVIKQDKTEPEFGGGICQVSTTAFRAAINSGLKITARRNHAYPVAYYNPQGMDATIYIPKPDLKFVNNTPSNILIQTKIEGTQLTFQFFGTNDGRKVEIVGPKILERKPDGSMKTTFSQKVSDKDGNIFINDVFNSNYDSPSKYPHPGEQKLTSKPKGWSDNEWKKYKQTN